MNSAESILKYKTSMSVFRKWLADGVISEADLLFLDALLAEKYSLSNRSIFLENDLLCKEERVMNGL